MIVRVGTRGSALALAQARTTAAALERASGDTYELVIVRTEGDTSQASLATIGGTGVFAGALRTALKAGTCDVVIHSLKDLPVAPEPGLTVVSVPAREDPRDVLCARGGRSLDELAPGATVGTGSPRRHAQLVARRGDLTVVDLRGNVDTRLGRVRDGQLDAVVLSHAGLSRLDRLDAVTETFSLESWPTAAGQGALAIEVRDEDAAHLTAPFPAPTAIGSAAAAVAEQDAWDAVAAERVVLRALEAGCSAPIGVASSLTATEARLWASVHRPGGGSRLDRSRTLHFADAHGASRRAQLHACAAALAADLLDAGAAELAPLGATA